MPWDKAEEGDVCSECGDTFEGGEDVYVSGHDTYCEGCNEDMTEEYYDDHECDDDSYLIDGIGFADPGGRSALRAETEDNPRNLPCPTCGTENVLTPADRAAGYQCDSCADQAEGGGY
jgi:hypothetical protein